jgi:ribonucleotide monophosphatase NagD (HAD superfamily)
LLSQYSKIILDVSQTLYDDNRTPLEGSFDFLEKYQEKIVIISNIGSLTGNELRNKLNIIFNINITKVITSLDLVIDYLKKKKYDNIYHYGSNKVLGKLKRETNFNFIEDYSSSNIETLLFTSLCTDGSWINLTQNTLNLMARGDINIILGNPDRSCPVKPHNFTVSLIHDALLSSCIELGYSPTSIEIGKPNIKMEEMGISLNEKTVVVGDNSKTDGLLAVKNKFDYIQVGNRVIENELFKDILLQNVRSLTEIV